MTDSRKGTDTPGRQASSPGQRSVFKTAERLIAVLESGRAKTALSRSAFFTQTLHVFDATLQQAEMDEFLNVACVGVEKALDEISEVFTELLMQAKDNYYDLLGVMYMLAQVRWGSGEEYTPWDLVRLITLLNLQGFTPTIPCTQPYTFYDPCCGSGALLLGVLEYMDFYYPELLDQGLIKVYGQEKSPVGWLMCRVNLRLHDLGRCLRRPEACGGGNTASHPRTQDAPSTSLEPIQKELFRPLETKREAGAPKQGRVASFSLSRSTSTAPNAHPPNGLGPLFANVEPLFPKERTSDE